MNRSGWLATALLAAALGLPQSHAQQRIFKYVLPDGRIVYSDKPVPGARLDEEIEPPPPPDMSAPPAARPSEPKGAGAPAAEDRAKALDRAWEDLKLWTRKLEEARVKLAAGREPLEGERTGTATGGASRLNDAYWQRQKDNEAAVAEAEARVREAQEAVNRLR